MDANSNMAANGFLTVFHFFAKLTTPLFLPMCENFYSYTAVEHSSVKTFHMFYLFSPNASFLF